KGRASRLAFHCSLVLLAALRAAKIFGRYFSRTWATTDKNSANDGISPAAIRRSASRRNRRTSDGLSFGSLMTHLLNQRINGFFWHVPQQICADCFVDCRHRWPIAAKDLELPKQCEEQ